MHAAGELSQAQRERLSFLEMHVFFTGELRRSDIEARFGVKPAAASRDLSLYRELAEGNLDYDPVSRCYRPTAFFRPLNDFQSERVLSWLLQGFGDGLACPRRSHAPCEGPGQLVRPNLATLGLVTRAMCAGTALKIQYLSLSSGGRWREVVPVALADNGLRWHVRAYDRERRRFSDFVLTRIVGAEVLPGAVSAHEALSADEQWARVVDMEVVPHPGVSVPAAVEADYGMVDGMLHIKARAALAGYVLRRWSIDSSPDHSLDPSSHHLWLRNTVTLYGVESAPLAPGYAVAHSSAQSHTKTIQG